jgi:hypothetical protein
MLVDAFELLDLVELGDQLVDVAVFAVVDEGVE